MSNQDQEYPNPQQQKQPPPPQPPTNAAAATTTTRPVGGTEYSWCKAVPQGTGTTVLALHLTKQPDLSLLKASLHHLQLRHPLLRSSLLFHPSTSCFSFLTYHPDHLHHSVTIQTFDHSQTSEIISNTTNQGDRDSLSPYHIIVEHEMNNNTWSMKNHDDETQKGKYKEEEEVFFVSLYELGGCDPGSWVVVLRLHTVACDRVAAFGLLRELLELMCNGGGGGGENEIGREVEGKMGIEQCIPKGKANKPFWARGADVVGYTLNALRLSYLDFVDAGFPRCSQAVRLQINVDDTSRIFQACKSNGIKLCGALAAAAMIAARSYKDTPNPQQTEKYSFVTLIDCRPLLNPVLTIHDVGFYHSGIVNSHDINGEENFWDLAKRCYTSFTNAKNSNKHFTDMGDLNFLMCKAIDNPGLTPSTSQRTALLSVFEEFMVDDSNSLHKQLGVVDYMGCASIHGVGPSLAIFDTVRDGRLECSCVYPAPLHSREQMEKLVGDMKRIILEGCGVNVETYES